MAARVTGYDDDEVVPLSACPGMCSHHGVCLKSRAGGARQPPSYLSFPFPMGVGAWHPMVDAWRVRLDRTSRNSPLPASDFSFLWSSKTSKQPSDADPTTWM